MVHNTRKSSRNRSRKSSQIRKPMPSYMSQYAAPKWTSSNKPWNTMYGKMGGKKSYRKTQKRTYKPW